MNLRPSGYEPDELPDCSIPRYPIFVLDFSSKADDRTRTDNLLITNQLLCQLSHIGIHNKYFIFSDSDGNRTRVTAVKGRCLNRLTMEPKKKKTPRVGLEPTTTRLTAECSTIELSRIIKVCTFKTSYKSDLFFSVINQIKPSTY